MTEARNIRARKTPPHFPFRMLPFMQVTDLRLSFQIEFTDVLRSEDASEDATKDDMANEGNLLAIHLHVYNFARAVPVVLVRHYAPVRLS